MTAALIGHTGFVGGNLARQTEFDACYASRTIQDIRGRFFDLLVICAVPAAMWLANNQPEQDRANIASLFDHLRTTRARRAVLISTIAVYADPASRPNEASDQGYERRKAYGLHRREFEEMLASHFPSLLSLRLPALFGPGLSKNFLFDLINPIPSFLNAASMAQVMQASDGAGRELVAAAFAIDPKLDMWRFDRRSHGHGRSARDLEAILERAGIGATNFTNSDSRFQFYNLENLWRDIGRALGNGLPYLNLASEPLAASDVAYHLTGKPFESHSAPLVLQDMQTNHAAAWGRDDGYLYGTPETLAELALFYRSERARLSE